MAFEIMVMHWQLERGCLLHRLGYGEAKIGMIV